ncbi:DUF2225 domain-containing protein [Bacillus sp. RD4P76]|uniref:DUF2225 domain-containing protein n=2 Tax=Bacillus suaedaesalsae TaxID=2810349 RepID=A0ABS2DJM0_9BACI|nr:DUF2225 domain-containing protein [Bacillus suaedaesalsae]
MDILFDKNVKCMACDHNYTTKKVRSRFIRALHSDSDFCSYYADEENSPLLYYVSVCPGCGFSVSDEFSTYFAPSTLESIKHSISSQWNNRSYGEKRTPAAAIEAYKLGIVSATLKKERNIVLAGLYMRLVWIYRKEKNSAQELRFMKLAVSEYVKSYSNGDYQDTDMSDLKIAYLIGDLYRRLGDDKLAMTYLSRVIHRKEEKYERRMVEMAKELWSDIREDMKAKEQELKSS